MLNLNLSTIIFQMLNFFILLAILRYFLYTPLLQFMRQREEAIAARVRDAEERGKQADAEREALAVETEKLRGEADRILTAARAEATASSAKILEGARHEATQRVESAKQLAAEQERVAQRQVAARITDSVVTVAGEVIRAAAGPAVHQALVVKLADDRLGLSPEQLEPVRRAGQEQGSRITIQLAYPPTDEIKRQLTGAVERTLGMDLANSHVEFQVDSGLIAGARILIGTTAIDFSLAQILAEIKEHARQDAESAKLAVTA